jgi:hypothetical protein
MLSLAPFYEAQWTSSNFSTAAYKIKEHEFSADGQMRSHLCLGHPLFDFRKQGKVGVVPHRAGDGF